MPKCQASSKHHQIFPDLDQKTTTRPGNLTEGGKGGKTIVTPRIELGTFSAQKHVREKSTKCEREIITEELLVTERRRQEWRSLPIRTRDYWIEDEQKFALIQIIYLTTASEKIERGSCERIFGTQQSTHSTRRPTKSFSNLYTHLSLIKYLIARSYA